MKTLLYTLVLLSVISLQAQTYTEITTNITPSIFGAIDFADYDNDGDQDLALIGVETGFIDIADIYRNDEGVFIPINAGIAPMHMGAISWSDYDSDGDYDLLCSGQDYSMNAFAIIYENNNGSFIPSEIELPAGFWNSSGWGDYDNDGDLDLAFSYYAGNVSYSEIFINDGGSFTNSNAGLPGLTAGSMEWGDYDKDGDLDLLLTGTPTDFSSTPLLLFENSEGTFTDTQIEFMDCAWYNNAIWDDIDGDMDLDIIYVGDDGTSFFLVYYLNNNGSFEIQNTGLPGVRTSNGNISMLTGDVDNDGDMDVVMTGDDPNYNKSTKIYINNAGSYTALEHAIPGYGSGSIDLSDIDNDGDLDILLAGYDNATNADFGLFINDANSNTYSQNEAPASPDGLNSVVDGNTVTLTWNMASDDHTPGASLQYNLYIGTSAGMEDIVCSQSETDPLSPNYGFHKLPKQGNCLTSLAFEMENLPDDIYYWSIQAIDQSGVASVFAEEQFFNIGNVIGINEVKLSFTVVPNPAYEQVRINHSFGKEVNIEIIDLMGRQVHYEEGLQSGSSIDVSRLNKGHYSIRVFDEVNLFTRKLVIQ